MSLSQKVLRGAGWIASASYINLIIAFVGNWGLTRLLLPDDFGVFALAYSFLALISMFAGFGSQEAIVQYREARFQAVLLPTAFWMTVGFNFLLAIAGTVTGLILGVFYEPIIVQLVIALSWMNFLFNIGAVYEMILQRDLRFRPLAISTTIATIVSFLIALGFAWQGWGVWSLLIRELIAHLIQFIFWRIQSRYRIEWIFDREAAQWIWRFGWRMMFTRVSEVIFSRVDNLLVGTFLGTAVLGHYTLAYRLAYLGQQVTQGALQTLVFSTFSAIQHDSDKLLFGFTRLNYWLLRLVLPGGGLVLAIGQPLVVWVYGTKWALAGETFQAMFLFLMMLPILGSLRQFLIGAGYVELVVRARIVQLVTFGITIGFAIAAGTLTAVVIAVTVSFLAGLIDLLLQLRQIIAVRWLYLGGFPLIAAVCGTVAALFVPIPSIVIPSLWVEIGWRTILLAGTYGLLLIALEYRTLYREWQIIRRQIT